MIVTIPGGSIGKEFAYNANGDLSGDSSSIPGSRWSPGERKGNPLQYPSWEYPMEEGVEGYSPGSGKSWTQLSG